MNKVRLAVAGVSLAAVTAVVAPAVISAVNPAPNIFMRGSPASHSAVYYLAAAPEMPNVFMHW